MNDQLKQVKRKAHPVLGLKNLVRFFSMETWFSRYLRFKNNEH